MILYTPLTQEDIFPEENERQLQVVDVAGKKVFIDEVEGKPTVVQLVSTNPHDYMDPTLSPGNEIEWK